jgi:carboxyl-terminal processing protease
VILSMVLRFFKRHTSSQSSPLSARLAVVVLCMALCPLTGCSLLNNKVNNNQPLPTNTPQSAIELYDSVWQAVEDRFVDTGTNHQKWAIWRHRYDAKLQQVEDAYVAIDTMLASLNDDYTRLMPPKDMAAQNMHIAAKLFGVGLQIAVKQKKLLVVAPMPNTPASQAGLQSLDHITHVDNTPTEGLTVEEAANKIRGPKGTQVTLNILRGSTRLVVPLKRAEIHVQSVEVKALKTAPQIGYVQLSTFISETATDELQEALAKLDNKQGLILDVRNNPGGLLSNALAVADLFLDAGDIVTVENRQHQTQHYGALPGQLFAGPIIVLINGGSASASEIVAGALQDHHRAQLVGTTSFGKGLVQQVLDMPGKAGLTLTVSRYRTPSGRDIHIKGIQPDVTVPLDFRQPFPETPDSDPQVKKAIALLTHTKASQSVANTH